MFVSLPQLWLLILCRSKDHLLVCNNRLLAAPRCSTLSRLLGCRKKPKTDILYRRREKEEEGRRRGRKKERIEEENWKRGSGKKKEEEGGERSVSWCSWWDFNPIDFERNVLSEGSINVPKLSATIEMTNASAADAWDTLNAIFSQSVVVHWSYKLIAIFSSYLAITLVYEVFQKQVMS